MQTGYLPPISRVRNLTLWEATIFFDPAAYLQSLFYAAGGFAVILGVPLLASKIKGGIPLMLIGCSGAGVLRLRPGLYLVLDEGLTAAAPFGVGLRAVASGRRAERVSEATK